MRSRIAALVVSAVLTSSLALFSAGPAQAAVCTPSYSHSIDAVEVGVSFTWAPECSDGVAQIWNGIVRDTLCDGRAAEVWFKVYDRAANGGYVLLATSRKYPVTNGCGNSASFPTWRPRSPGTVGWQLMVLTRACNGWGCSEPRERALYG